MAKVQWRIIKICLAAAAVFLLLGLICEHVLWSKVLVNHKARTNTQCTTDQRVFDEAGKLTEEEKKKLESEIAEDEQKAGADMVLLIVDDASLSGYDVLRDYAQNVYLDHHFGWNEADGDGMLYVDNWATGETWMAVRGSCEKKIGTRTQQYIMKGCNKYVNSDPYKGYSTLMKLFTLKMVSLNLFRLNIPWWICLAIALVIMLISGWMQYSSHTASDTTVMSTYVAEGGMREIAREDIFLSKNVIRTEIKQEDDRHGGGSDWDIGGTGGFGGSGGFH